MRSLGAFSLLLSFTVAVLSGWLLFVTAPEAEGSAARARAELTRQQSLADQSAAHSLALAAFARDYGEVQELLNRYREIGYANQALVTNLDRVVVASVGAFPDVSIGSRIPESLATGGRVVRLTLRAQGFGELRVFAPVAMQPGAETGLSDLRLLAIALFATSIAAFLAFAALRLRRQ